MLTKFTFNFEFKVNFCERNIRHFFLGKLSVLSNETLTQILHIHYTQGMYIVIIFQQLLVHLELIFFCLN